MYSVLYIFLANITQSRDLNRERHYAHRDFGLALDT